MSKNRPNLAKNNQLFGKYNKNILIDFLDAFLAENFSPEAGINCPEVGEAARSFSLGRSLSYSSTAVIVVGYVFVGESILCYYKRCG